MTTDPTADAAKLLPCPQGEIPADRWNELSASIIEAAKTWKDTSEDRAAMMLFSHRDSVIRFIWPIIQRWNTRPQPAGEPDFTREADMLLPDDFPSSTDPNAPYTRGYKRQNLADEIAAELRRAYRLGLAAQPKVEDVDEGLRRQAAANAELIVTYRDIFAEITAKAAPLTSDGDRITSYAIPCGPIHRAAGKLGFQMFDGEKNMREVLAKLVEERQRAEIAEAKLAEREAELAKAEWTGYENGLICAGNLKPRISRGEEGTRVLNDLRAQIDEKLAAARQQQKASAEPTEGEGK